jgi:ubiquinol-cytochrome c reductase core subunit 2
VIDAVKAYAARVFTKENVAVIGSGVSETTLAQLVQNKFSSLPSGSQIDLTKATKYVGAQS